MQGPQMVWCISVKQMEFLPLTADHLLLRKWVRFKTSWTGKAFEAASSCCDSWMQVFQQTAVFQQNAQTPSERANSLLRRDLGLQLDTPVSSVVHSTFPWLLRVVHLQPPPEWCNLICLMALQTTVWKRVWTSRIILMLLWKNKQTGNSKGESLQPKTIALKIGVFQTHSCNDKPPLVFR